jgi:dipeptidyl aminopeptidase/acylaminoacyl peptidase
MRRMPSLLLAGLLLAGCGGQEAPEWVQPVTGDAAARLLRESSAPHPGAAAKPEAGPPSLTEARHGFVSKLAADPHSGTAPPEPPSDVFRRVRYDSPAGKLAAYLTPDPGDGQKHPAIVWITGGDCNTIDALWDAAPRDNDQTAAAYRKAGIVMMFPSLRGGNDNPGRHEGFLGEVDDVIAAAKFLAQQGYVDRRRIYLGGHSTGGTLVMLVAASTDGFRAVFSFGPAAIVSGYGPEFLPFDTSNPREIQLRSPGHWLHSVQSPLFVFEGTEDPSNIKSLQAMSRASTNPLIRFLPVSGVSHFSILGPANELIAGKILHDEGLETSIAFSAEELGALGKK